MNAKPFLSVIIPTYNRARLLPLTIDSFLAQDYPSDLMEILVVDNHSTDNTAEIIRLYEKDNPGRVRYLYEDRQGVHYARNSAFHHSRGDILYYTDDDMVAAPDMLKNLMVCFERDPLVGSATGRVVPRWESPPPAWILKYCNNHLLSLITRPEDFVISPHNPGVFSCHQAMRRDAFARSGGFNPENTCGEWLGDGETGLNIKIRQLGYKFAYNAASVTEHIIPASRTTQAYLDKRLANQGNCDSYTEYRARGRQNNMELCAQALSFVFRAAVSLIAAAVLWSARRDSWHLRKAFASYQMSRARYALRLVRDPAWREMVRRDNWLDEETGR